MTSGVQIPEGLFRFKRFNVCNSLPAQRVGTDGVLLGAAASIDFLLSRGGGQVSCEWGINVLDIGTGTGLVALMLAQRLADAGVGDVMEITGIDIDAPAAESAAQSFSASVWSDHMRAIHRSLEDFSDDLYRADDKAEKKRFDMIVSNPPYYDNSLECPDERRNLARHTSCMSWREVVSFAGDFLSPGGRLSLILPKQDEKHLVRFASSFGLRPVRLLSISTTPTKPARRLVAEFERIETGSGTATITELMVMGDEKYQSITKEFYL